MTAPIKATDRGLRPHFKVRVCLRGGGIIHLASASEPEVVIHPDHPDLVVEVRAVEWISDPAYGDTLGFVDWAQAAAVTWRWSG